MDINDVLSYAVETGASDVHLTVGLKPIIRHNGQLKELEKEAVLTAEMIDNVAEYLIKDNDTYLNKLHNEKHLDLAYSIAGMGRFRVNIYTQRGSRAVAIRIVSSTIPKVDELGLPESVASLAEYSNGLVLITGPTGSGKSTTLAAVIDKINRERSLHVITLEDPIEFTHRHMKSIVNQREIGSDAEGFASALKSTLRQDPDVILVGEMRDLDTISIALTAAETGHLVFGTLHTINAPQTIERIIDVFPAEQQRQIRTQLSNTLQAVIAQQLLSVEGKTTRVPAAEVLFASPAVRNLIREGKTHQIISTIQTSGKLGMQTMDSSLRMLFQKGLISEEELQRRSHNNL